jgi:hypothetical protein
MSIYEKTAILSIMGFSTIAGIYFMATGNKK